MSSESLGLKHFLQEENTVRGVHEEELVAIVQVFSGYLNNNKLELAIKDLYKFGSLFKLGLKQADHLHGKEDLYGIKILDLPHVDAFLGLTSHSQTGELCLTICTSGENQQCHFVSSYGKDHIDSFVAEYFGSTFLVDIPDGQQIRQNIDTAFEEATTKIRRFFNENCEEPGKRAREFWAKNSKK